MASTLRSFLPLILSVCAIPAFADETPANAVTVSAESIVTCDLRVSVPKAGSAERAAGGTARFDAQCTRGARITLSDLPSGFPIHAVAPALTQVTTSETQPGDGIRTTSVLF